MFYWDDIFEQDGTSVSQVHDHNTRGSHYNFQLSRELSFSPNSFAFSAIKEWKDLPVYIKSIGEFRVFKTKLKEYLISRYSWCIWLIWQIRNWILPFKHVYLHFFSFIYAFVTNHIFILWGLCWKKVDQTLTDYPPLQTFSLQFPKIVYLCLLRNKFIHSIFNNKTRPSRYKSRAVLKTKRLKDLKTKRQNN